MKKFEAIWGSDYDYQNDVIYKRPVCPVCKEPFGKRDDEKYHCYDCGRVIKVNDPGIRKWIRDRAFYKVESEDCWNCGSEKTMEIHYRKDKVTLAWRSCWGSCSKCGMRWIV